MQIRASNDQYKIDIESFLSLPCHVYWKDKKGVILGCNDIQARNVGFKTGDELIGKTDFDLCWKLEALVYAENDQEVIRTNKSKLIEEPVRFFDGTTGKAMAYKMPLHDRGGDVVGVFGLSTIFSLEESGFDLNDFQSIQIKKTSYANISFKNIKFAKREKECVHYLVRGMTAKQIARKLDLSPRTVEFYLERCKAKLGCQNRSELISKVINANLKLFN